MLLSHCYYQCSKNRWQRNQSKTFDFCNSVKELYRAFGVTSTQNVRRNMIPGNSKSLWDAVKIAKDLNIEPIPTNMYGEGELLTHADMPDHFASFFNKKVIDIMSATVIDNEIYNGEKKVESSDLMFMDKGAIKECILSLKVKNSEGYRLLI